MSKDKKNKVLKERRCVITSEADARRDSAKLELQGFKVTKTTLPSYSIMIIGERYL